MIWLVLWLHVLALAVWLGTVAGFSFVVAPAVFGALPVQQAGELVGHIFPAYYALGYGAGAVLFGSAALLRRWTRPAGGAWLASALIAGAALAVSLYAGLFVQPRASALRPQLHEAGAPAAVREEFDALHASAVRLNGAVFLAQIALAGIIAAQLRGAAVVPRRLSRLGGSDLQW
ncbi:MAG: DUF4149 domain-containing protein [Deltaproteobacteria bacterium]|nr:DUF4149 domain-containing protein [Deltaproteobacteria bacterium]